MRKIKLPLILFSLLVFFIACEEDESTTDAVVNNAPSEELANYFYDFENFRYDLDFYKYTSSEILRPALFNERILHFNNFDKFVVNSNSTDLYTEREELDLNENHTVLDSVTINMTPYRDVESLRWDNDKSRYVPETSDWMVDDTTFQFLDEMVFYSERAMLDTMIATGTLIIDDSLWVQNERQVSTSDTTFSFTFEKNRTILPDDSPIFRVITDCNNNHVQDDAEEFEDSGNDGCCDDCEDGNGGCIDGCESVCSSVDYDPENPNYDPNDDNYDQTSDPNNTEHNNLWNTGESFEDRGNGIEDAAEPCLSDDCSIFDDWNCNGEWDPAEDWSAPDGDLGNGIYDPAEEGYDRDGNGTVDAYELFAIGVKPENPIVDYSDPDNPEMKTLATAADTILTRFGERLPLITTIAHAEEKSASIANLDSIVVLETNKVIEFLPEGDADEYNLVKTRWMEDEGDPFDYDYFLFNTDNTAVNMLTHKSFFWPNQAYNDDWVNVDNLFWLQAHPSNEAYIYAPNGKLRDGDVITLDSLYQTGSGEYIVETTFSYEKARVTIPLDLEDTIIQEEECFRITRNTKTTLIGPGDYFQEKVVTHLAKDYGIVKEEVFYRWYTGYWNSQDDWDAISKWELVHFEREPASMNRLFGGKKHLHLNRLQEESELSNEPYRIRKTFGMHRVENLFE